MLCSSVHRVVNSGKSGRNSRNQLALITEQLGLNKSWTEDIEYDQIADYIVCRRKVMSSRLDTSVTVTTGCSISKSTTF